MQSTSTETAALPVSRRRSNLEVCCDILDALRKAKNQSLRKTGIVYQCNLTWKSSKPFIERLIAKGMMEVVSARGFKRIAFRLTEDGLSFIQSYRLMMKKLFDEPIEEGIWP